MISIVYALIYNKTLINSFFDIDTHAHDPSNTSVTRSIMKTSESIITRSLIRTPETNFTRSLMKTSESSVTRPTPGISKNSKNGLYALIKACLCVYGVYDLWKCVMCAQELCFNINTAKIKQIDLLHVSCRNQ